MRKKKENDMSIIFKYLQEIDNKVKILKKRIGDDCLIAYRAEDKDYGSTRFTPSLFRGSNDNIIEKELNVKNILMDYGFFNNNNNPSLFYPIEAQHYGLGSRLIDISFNSLVSLFFVAMNPLKLEEDGIIYVFGFPEYFSPNDSNIAKLYDKMISGESPIIEKNFKVLTHCRVNERIKIQNGGFIMFFGDKRYEIPKIYYEPVSINHDDYDRIKTSLKELFGIDLYSIYPEEENIKEVLKSRSNSIQFSIDFESQVKEYLKRVKFEFDCLDNNINRLRKMKEEKIYIKELIKDIETNYNKANKKDIIDVLKKANAYLDYMRATIQESGEKTE